MVLRTTHTPQCFVNRLVLTNSEWMTFAEWRMFSVENGNGNDEGIEFVWSRCKSTRYRNGQLAKLIITGLTWA